ncbi:hypothetical protein HPB48_009413 [Haemaphysalis longicornis]|uniref:F-box domain-containing protein n=1 Tax=Haemaphysalis longicornis TaxID=44386 RepID=A0A9J6GKU0_HAELO|nr:hypothetical protein HPB48_009413 [Haemaphysalis longicornis]
MAETQGSPLLESLPNDAAALVFQFLDWYERLSVAALSRRLHLLSSRGTFLRHSRFSLRDHPMLFTYVAYRPRAELIQELDVSNYITASSNRLEMAIRKCVNLTVLRCVHTRLHPLTMVFLLQNHLRKLKHLEWSILSNQAAGFPIPEFLVPTLNCVCWFAPATLRYMYLEALCTDFRTVEFVCLFLGHCHALSRVHFHERGAARSGSYVACEVLYSVNKATDGCFQSFVYTSERLPCDLTLPTVAPAFVPTGDSFLDLSICVDVFHNITIHQYPRHRRSCVHLAETVASENMEGLQQLSVVVQDSGDVADLLKTAYEQRTYRHVEALTLMFLVEPAQQFRGLVENRATLCNFLRSCPLLTEISFFAFHSDTEFDYLSILATGGLNHLRRLALVACALCSPMRLQRLAQAPFQLRELDVRSFRGKNKDGRVVCQLCRDETTCNDACLAPMRLLRHLRRLTLCELFGVRRLAFLEGCESLVHLRMRNLGLWCFQGPQDMSGMRHVWSSLLSLKLESSVLPLGLGFLSQLPPSERLERLCVGTIGRDARVTALRPHLLRPHCPNAEAIHVHLRNPDARGVLSYINAPTYNEVEPVTNGDVAAVWLLSRDQATLCYCMSYIGLAKPRCLKVP